MSRWAHLGILLLVLLALFLPRFLGLDRFVTVDEPKWLVRSASFYAALAHGDLRGTFQREHPGVTVTWAGAAGFLWRFPGYYKIVPDISLTPTRFQNYISSVGRDSLELLVAGRLFILVGIVLALGLAYVLAARMLGALPAAFAFLLVALNPFHIALSRQLHLDGLLSSLMLLSILAFAGYLYFGRRKRDLLLSAVAGGLAWLTKSPAIFLAPFFGLLLLGDWLQDRRRSPALPGQTHWLAPARMWRDFSPLIVWFAVAATVFVLLWPAMWVDPLGTLERVFSQATIYASEGHELPSLFYGRIYPDGKLPATFYPLVTLWRITPVTLGGLVLALFAWIFPRRLVLDNGTRQLLGTLLVFSILFTAFMSLGAKKFDRYLLPVFPALDLIAAIGYLALLASARVLSHRYLPGVLLGLVLVVQSIGVLQTYPYYFNFYNPLMGGHRKAAEVLLIGWGEGLDRAADYLNSVPRSEKTRVVAWYGDGCLSYYYKGSTVPIGLDTTLNDLRRTDYVVLYRNQWERELPEKAFIQYFDSLTPEHVVTIDGLEYARIYRP